MLNQMQVIGHLGRDPEIRYLNSGAAVCSFTVATTEKWKDKEGNPCEETEWHRVSCFDKLAEICGQYLTKGSLVFVEGKLKTRKYTDKDGVEKSTTEIQCKEMKMLGGRPQGDDSQRQAPQQRQAAPQQRQPAPQQRQPAARAPARQAPPSSGFDDMDSDIPF